MGINCGICNQEFSVITHKHLKKHNITLQEYKEQYGPTYGPEYSDKLSKIGKGKKMGDDNPARRIEVKEKISQSLKKLWHGGTYCNRINGMIGKVGELHHGWKSENHTQTFLAEKEYWKFLANFQNTAICSRCGLSKSEMNVHHIDEDHSNFLPSNLEPLCVPCHTSYHYKLQKQPFLTVSKDFSFAGAHFLPDYSGKCANLHGHEWKLSVAIRKRIDKKTGMVIDFGDIKQAVNNTIVDQLDHHCLNDLIYNPTAENILVWAWEELMFIGLLKGIKSITLWETPTSQAVITDKDMLSVFSSNIEDYLLRYKQGEY